MFQVYVNKISQLSNKRVGFQLLGTFAVELIYCNKAIHGTAILFPVLRDYLVLIKCNKLQPQNRNKILFEVAKCIVPPKDR